MDNTPTIEDVLKKHLAEGNHFRQWDKITAAMREWSSLREERVIELEDCLRWLVNLKAHKDQNGKDELYQHEQPEAWVRAKELLNK